MTDSVKDIEKIATLSSSHKLLIQFKASKHEYRDITRWKYTILSVCDTISKEINTLTQTDTSNDAEVSQVLEIVEEQSGKSLGITELREQMSNEDKVLADLVPKPTARNNATKKLKLMISKSAVAILVRSTFYASFFILPYRCQGLWYGMHYGYDDLQYGKDRVGVLYTKFWTSLLYFRKDFDLPCK
ncbi:hypothetical protein FEM48_Zijuj10G0039400 [Ziziphus jujuba var. spinosa]|uniref:Uncharacterized protein n=1 Tax=Ziziphus jujuba var. spinosa TaxID=714518 RepID=A0A978UL55_ZIZJJ|nr:hypothetical protein FEM48_Zijuj10G0039400 [Ziziphus jujuba var. spinosa]